MISGQCAFCGGAKAFDFKRYCSDWCRAQQAAANDAPPLPGDYDSVTRDAPEKAEPPRVLAMDPVLNAGTR